MEFLTRKLLPLGLLLLLPVSTALSSHHSWKIHEVFSNADGTLQFVEMLSNADNHNQITCCKVVAGNKTTGVDTGYDFPSNIASGATNGIKPDYIIPDGFLTTGPGTCSTSTRSAGTACQRTASIPTQLVAARDRPHQKISAAPRSRCSHLRTQPHRRYPIRRTQQSASHPIRP